MLSFYQTAEKSNEVMKHVCKLCNKTFSCGRSLGGHMRSHFLDPNDHNRGHKTKINETEELIENDLCYELRKDPKKTRKVKDSNEIINDDLVVLDKICKQCGKGFRSWKALFGHMKCHSDKVSNSRTGFLKHGPRISQPDYETSEAKNLRMKISRASSSVSMNANHDSPSVVYEIDQEQEVEVAMCLIMLSRDVRKRRKKIAQNELGFDRLAKTITTRDEFDDQSDKKFECTTCNKSFYTYQALGGHKASHKKLKRCFGAEKEDKNLIKNEPMSANDYMMNPCGEKRSENDDLATSFNPGMVLGVGVHECSICLRIFSSGQALGGHKRSHLIDEAKPSRKNPNLIKKFDKPGHEFRGFLDLNMPPDSEEEEQQETVTMNPSDIGIGYKPWYYDHESTLLGPLLTS